MGDLHLMIIDDIGEVVCRESVRLDQDGFIQHVGVKFYAAVDLVIKISFADIVDGLADDVRLAGCDPCFCLFQRDVFARIIVFEGDAQAVCFPTLTLDFFLAAEAVMRAAQFHELFSVCFVHRKTFGLYIWSMIAADIRSFIVLQTNCTQRIIDDVGGPFHQTALIGIFDAEDEISAFMFGDQVLE